MDLHRDFRDLLAEFVRAGVRFALIGGYAVGHHATPRATKDLDLLVSGQGNNLLLVSEALARFGAPPNVVAAARTMSEDEIVYFGAPPVRIDILRSAEGIDTEVALARAEQSVVNGLAVPVLAFDDLLANKKAAGRKQDLADVETLLRFQRSRGGE